MFDSSHLFISSALQQKPIQPLKKVLTIAGSDSGGGAGIQADLKTITVLGLYGSTVITAVTAQNTLGVRQIQQLEPACVKAQLQAVLSDIGSDSIKIGMLANHEIMAAIKEVLADYQAIPVVLDPVMLSKTGFALIDPASVSYLKEELFSLATVITPNCEEASALLGRPVASLEEQQAAARDLNETGAKWVLIKGGHSSDSEWAEDVLYGEGQFWFYRAKRLDSRHSHGTGCTLSSAIASFMAKGLPVPEAVAEAKQYLTTALATAWPLGQGTGPVHHLWPLDQEEV